MAETRSSLTNGISQVSTNDVEPGATPAEDAQELYPNPVASPAEAAPKVEGEVQPRDTKDLDKKLDRKEMEPGLGLEGEFVVWEGRLSYRNFLGRAILRGIATVGWLVLAYYAWGRGDGVERLWGVGAGVAGVALLLWWLSLGWQIFYGRKSHLYRLSNKRLFVWTGVFSQRVDQLELLRVNDVYVNHKSLLARMLNVGTVVVESSEERFPVTYLVGVDEPEQVMDTLWHASRAEREGHTVRVDEV